MENNSLPIVNNFLKHLTDRNLEDLTLLFSENLDWYIPGDESKAEWLGKRSNRKEVSAFYELLWNETEPISAKIDSIFTDRENAVITGEFSTRMLATDKVVDSMFCIQMQIQNNQIKKYRLLEDSYAVSKALSR